MAQRSLNELLREDQEPFMLQSYIAERRSQIRSPSCQVRLRELRRIKKRKPITEKPNFPGDFGKISCLLHVGNSPEISKSPRNAVFGHIPARTTALLLEAALRIQKKSSPPKLKTAKNHGFGLFESVVKRFWNRNRSRNRENSKISAGKKSGGFFSNQSTPITAILSETDGDKSPELETSSSGHQQFEESQEIFLCREDDNVGVCESPFHFVLHRSPSSGDRTPELLSPENSPSRHKSKEEEKVLRKLESGGEEEEKEQNSPVSVLDPPFEDDDGNDDDDDNIDSKSSYAIVERAKLQLLQKLRRFEKLADLDPIELEKRMQENDDHDEEQEHQCEYETASSYPKFLKLLVSDIVREEEEGENEIDEEEAMKRVAKRLEAWKEVEANTIDMMVQQDFRGELGLWKRNEEEVEDTLAEIEVSLFGILVEELLN